MKPFATLLDRLVYTPGRNAKVTLLREYFANTPDPDRGYALATLTGNLPFTVPTRRVVAALMEPRIDPVLYRMSRDYVGDTAETVALLWPGDEDYARELAKTQAASLDAATDEPELPFGDAHLKNDETVNAVASSFVASERSLEPLRLNAIVETLQQASRAELPALLARWLDQLDTTGRWALLKFLSGGLRVGVSARLAKTALASYGNADIADIEEVWHGVTPPYAELFAWLDGKGLRPDASGLPVFRPLMLSHPLEDADWDALALEDIAAEWKWDGIRVQISSANGETRLYSRTGDDIGKAFPDVTGAINGPVVLDGELLIVRDGTVAPFNDLQQRLNRKTVAAKIMAEFPAHVRLYDALFIDGEDIRGLSFSQRREQLEKWFATHKPANADLSSFVEADTKEELRTIWESTRGSGIEGLMLKRRDSPYLAGRPKGHWWKWKRAPLTLDCVLMYAQRGSGKRSSFFSDYTFGVWKDVDAKTQELVPVGKAYSGFTDAELTKLDKWVRDHAGDRFGPVRAVTEGIVFEVAFDAVQRSKRHKSGIAMRFPRIHRIRWDKPVEEADRLETIEALLD